jgi:hypothetical protein
MAGFPKHMFMVCSPRVREYFEAHPTETYMHFPAGTMAIPVLQVLKDWFRYMGSKKSGSSLKLRGTMQQDLAIRRDCVFLGMDKYVAHFTRKYCDYIRGGFIGLDKIALIERNTADDDTLWDCLCNNLEVLRLRGAIPEPEKFEQFAKAHPRLQQALDRIEARLRPRGDVRQNGDRSRAPSRAVSTAATTRAVSSNKRAASPPESNGAKKTDTTKAISADKQTASPAKTAIAKNAGPMPARSNGASKKKTDGAKAASEGLKNVSALTVGCL